jgi:hypothetical protein
LQEALAGEAPAGQPVAGGGAAVPRGEAAPRKHKKDRGPILGPLHKLTKEIRKAFA